VTYLVGSRGVMPYRILYVLGFFFASFADTTLIWSISAISIFLSTVPNLLGIILLKSDMKQTVADYWVQFHREHPEER